LVWLSLASIGSDRIGSDRIGSDRIGSVRFGSVRFGSVRFGLYGFACVVLAQLDAVAVAVSLCIAWFDLV
jgi:hypothetical protein